DKCGINVVLQDHSIHALGAEHIDVLALLHFIRHIIDGCLFRLFLFILIFFGGCGIGSSFAVGFCGVGSAFGILGSLFGFCIFFDAVFQGQIFAIDVFVQHIVHHLGGEFLVLDASEFQERADVIPEFLVILTV